MLFFCNGFLDGRIACALTGLPRWLPNAEMVGLFDSLVLCLAERIMPEEATCSLFRLLLLDRPESRIGGTGEAGWLTCGNKSDSLDYRPELHLMLAKFA